MALLQKMTCNDKTSGIGGGCESINYEQRSHTFLEAAYFIRNAHLLVTVQGSQVLMHKYVYCTHTTLWAPR